MKLVTFRDKSGAERAGALYAEGARIADLAGGYASLAGLRAPALSSLQSPIEGGPEALDLARRALHHVEWAEVPGTVGGACGLEIKRFLSPGDVVELEVEGIGVLRNRIVEEE